MARRQAVRQMVPHTLPADHVLDIRVVARELESPVGRAGRIAADRLYAGRSMTVDDLMKIARVSEQAARDALQFLSKMGTTRIEYQGREHRAVYRAAFPREASTPPRSRRRDTQPPDLDPSPAALALQAAQQVEEAERVRVAAERAAQRATQDAEAAIEEANQQRDEPARYVPGASTLRDR